MSEVRNNSDRPRRTLAARLFLLLAILATAYGGVAAVVAGRGTAPGVIAAALAAGVCLTAAVTALVLAHLLSRPAFGQAALLLPMAVRTGLPLLVALAVRIRGPGLVDAGFLHYLVAFYLLALVVEVPLSLPLAQPARRSESVVPEDSIRHG